MDHAGIVDQQERDSGVRHPETLEHLYFRSEYFPFVTVENLPVVLHHCNNVLVRQVQALEEIVARNEPSLEADFEYGRVKRDNLGKISSGDAYGTQELEFRQEDFLRIES